MKSAQHSPRLLAAAAILMAYGWGYRGTVGSEGGAMVPGALLGIVLCLGSGRTDWQVRAAAAGLFGAIGWAWGGSFSYMEQTLYALSGSFPDALYGYAMLFFLGALWAGIGGGVLGLAFTEARSELERLLRPFSWFCAALLAEYLYFLAVPAHRDVMYTLSVRQFTNGNWLAAATALAVSGIYWLLRPKDRPATALLVWGSAAWWIGYLGLTKFGGLRLAPLHRNEDWGGILGVLVVTMIWLARRRNRAAFMLSMYGILGGGIAFSLAVFLRHPLAVQWGPFQGGWPHWRFAENTFGLFMGLAIALGAVRLLRGGLAAPVEDVPRARVDVYAAFAILIAVNWINFRQHVGPQAGHAPWFGFGGVLAALPVLYVLYRYLQGERHLLPQTAFGKGALLALVEIAATLAGYAHREAAAAGTRIAGDLLLWVPGTIGALLLLSFRPAAAVAAATPPSDTRWKVGRRYWLLCAAVPVFLAGFAALSVAMQNGPAPGMGRKRFGPDAYWRQTARLLGAWNVVGRARSLDGADLRTDERPLARLEFGDDRGVTATSAAGVADDTHQWFLKNQYTWLRWRGKRRGDPERAEIPLEFRGERIFLAWPPAKPSGFLVLERARP